MTTRERGTVASFDASQGHGKIASDSGGALLIVHFSFIRVTGVRPEFRMLSAGQRVEFTRVPQPDGAAASDVVVLAPAGTGAVVGSRRCTGSS
jgi:cold shock CspA family protein